MQEEVALALIQQEGIGFDYVNASGHTALTTAILCKNRKLSLEIIRNECVTSEC